MSALCRAGGVEVSSGEHEDIQFGQETPVEPALKEGSPSEVATHEPPNEYVL